MDGAFRQIRVDTRGICGRIDVSSQPKESHMLDLTLADLNVQPHTVILVDSHGTPVAMQVVYVATIVLYEEIARVT